MGNTDNESAQHLDSGGKKLSPFFLVLRTVGSNLWSLDLESDALPIEPHPVTPRPPVTPKI